MELIVFIAIFAIYYIFGIGYATWVIRNQPCSPNPDTDTPSKILSEGLVFLIIANFWPILIAAYYLSLTRD